MRASRVLKSPQRPSEPHFELTKGLEKANVAGLYARLPDRPKCGLAQFQGSISSLLGLVFLVFLLKRDEDLQERASADCPSGCDEHCRGGNNCNDPRRIKKSGDECCYN